MVFGGIVLVSGQLMRQQQWTENILRELLQLAANSQHGRRGVQMKLEKSKQEHVVQSAMEAQERNFGRITRSLSGEAL